MKKELERIKKWFFINLLNLYYIKFKTENKSNMIKNTRHFQEKQKSKFLKFDI